MSATRQIIESDDDDDVEFDYGVKQWNSSAILDAGHYYRLNFEAGSETVMFMDQAARAMDTWFFLTKDGRVFYVGESPTDALNGRIVVGPYACRHSGEFDWPESYFDLDEDLGFTIPPLFRDRDGTPLDVEVVFDDDDDADYEEDEYE